jgi:cell surface protein SprA
LKTDPDNIWQPDAGDAECVNVWVNELRLTDFVSDGGDAAIGQMQLQLADFANISASGNYSGINWGSVDSRVQDRQRNQKIGFENCKCHIRQLRSQVPSNAQRAWNQ